jgi:hypothetical protein
MGGSYITNWGVEEKYKILIRQLEGKRPLERSVPRLKDNIEMDLVALGWGGLGWIGFMWLRIQISGGLL